MTGQVLAGRPALEHPGRSCEEPDLVEHRRQLFVERQLHRLAGVLALRVDQLLATCLDGVRDAEQRALTLAGGGVAPGLEGGRGGGEGRVHVRGTRHRCGGEGGATGRVDEIGGAAVDRVGPVAADEVAQCPRAGHPSSRRG